MEVIRYQEFDNSSYTYWCNYCQGTIGFITLDELLDETKEFEISLLDINQKFYTDFTKEQFYSAIKCLGIYDFERVIVGFVDYFEHYPNSKENLTRDLHEIYGNSIDIPNDLINRDYDKTGFHQLIGDDKVIIFGINVSGEVTIVAFTFDFLPVLFDCNCSVQIDFFKAIPNTLLLDLLIEHYVSEGHFYDEDELKSIVKYYSRQRKLNCLLD